MKLPATKDRKFDYVTYPLSQCRSCPLELFLIFQRKFSKEILPKFEKEAFVDPSEKKHTWRSIYFPKYYLFVAINSNF